MTTRSDASVGAPINRVDGRLKVTGGARYAAEFPLPNVAHAVIVTSTIAKGRIRTMDTAAAERAPGVITVLTPRNAPRLPVPPRPSAASQNGPAADGAQGGQPNQNGQGGQAGQSGQAGQAGQAGQQQAPMRIPTLLQDDLVRYNGQPIGVVIAETLEQAMEAAGLVRVHYAVEPPSLDMASAPQAPPEQVRPTGNSRSSKRGDVNRGLAEAEVRIEQTYVTPLETHNPMETHTTLATWEGDRLTLYDSTQGIFAVRSTVARTFGIPTDKVRVVAYFTGGGFGSKGGPWSHVMLAAMAAKQVSRPVKLALTRRQMFGPVGGRPRTVQRVSLGATPEGGLTAIRHICTSHTSTIEDWTEPATLLTRMLYACPNTETEQRLVRINVGTPTFMRAPGESSGSFALESAMDELAYALRMDPLKLRLANYADRDPESQKAWSSKSLRECYEVGAERFGWSKRTPEPRSMRDGRSLVGWGVATATYPARTSPASAVARILADGHAQIRAGTQEIGTGTYTVMSQIAADSLGVPVDRVRFELGDTELPENPTSAGSMTAASTGSVVRLASAAARKKIIGLAIADRDSPLSGASESDVRVTDGRMWLASDEHRGETFVDFIARHGGQPVEATVDSRPGADQQQYSMHSFGCVFTEVRIDPDLGQVRVPRVVTAHAVGQILNAKTARSQVIGGVVWGVGMALMEATHVDSRTGRYVNADLAEYHVPVNADIGTIDVHLVEEHDPHVNPAGVKGIGEIGIVGVAASIANAVYHATGKRIRELPITLDKLL